MITAADPDAERVYRWHIEKRSGHRMQAGLATDKFKRSVDDYVDFAGMLYASMVARGFHHGGVVPVDQNGELLDGSHRVACAIALDIPVIPYLRMRERRAWAPAWGEEWFLENGCPAEDLERIRRDYTLITA